MKGKARTSETLKRVENNRRLRIAAAVKATPKTLCEDALNLTVSYHYLLELLGNARLRRFLFKRYPEQLRRIEKLVLEIEARMHVGVRRSKNAKDLT